MLNAENLTRNLSCPVKGTVSRDFQHFFIKKNLHLSPYEQAKQFLKIFHFREDIRENRVSQTTPTQCQRSR